MTPLKFIYDSHNIFARIIRKEIPATIIHETEHTLCFKDIIPQAPIHLLLIPKGPFTCAQHFYTLASDKEILDFGHCMGIVSSLVIKEQEGGRWISNQGAYGGQEVPHFHMHLLGGTPLGPMLDQGNHV